MKVSWLILVCLVVSTTWAISTYETHCYTPTGEGEAAGEGTYPGEGEGILGAGEGETPFVPDIFRQGGISVDEAFYSAVTIRSSTGLGCGHLATYDSQEELDLILESMYEAGAVYSLIGTRLDNGIFKWDAGRRTGQSFVDASTTDYSCAQDFCLYDNSQIHTEYNPDEVGMNLILFRYGGNYVVQLAPASGANCFTIEYPDHIDIPSVNGSPPISLYPQLLTWFEMEEAMIRQGGYLARMYNAEQNEAVREWFQCGRFYIWLGYYGNDDVLRLGAGPGAGNVIMHSREILCDDGYFCNWDSFQDFEGDKGVALNSLTGFWELRNPQARYVGFIERQVCDAAPSGSAYICRIVTGGGIQQETVSASDASRLVDSGQAYWPGGPYIKTIDGHAYYLYLDCDCKVDSRIDTACLTSTNSEECANSAGNNHLPGDLESNSQDDHPHSESTSKSSDFD